MASTLQSENVKGSRPAVIAAGAETVTVRGEYDLSAALVINDLIELVKLPADHVIVDCVLDTDDLDSNGTPLISLGVGKTAGTCVELIASNTIGRTGGMARLDVSTGLRIAPVQTETKLGVKVIAAPATGATSGKIGLSVSYRAARHGA